MMMAIMIIIIVSLLRFFFQHMLLYQISIDGNKKNQRIIVRWFWTRNGWMVWQFSIIIIIIIIFSIDFDRNFFFFFHFYFNYYFVNIFLKKNIDKAKQKIRFPFVRIRRYRRNHYFIFFSGSKKIIETNKTKSNGYCGKKVQKERKNWKRISQSSLSSFFFVDWKWLRIFSIFLD